MILFFCAGDGDVTEKPVEPVKVYSEKELIREFEKIASTLVPEKDWSHRIAAMQRVEALIFGGTLTILLLMTILTFTKKVLYFPCWLEM